MDDNCRKRFIINASCRLSLAQKKTGHKDRFLKILNCLKVYSNAKLADPT
jgi:hypothetical protein